ncbi:hypothetical protein KFE25_007946 [Diacronema lutheri]|uniref:Zinc transporter ZIP11 n=1 Tax=Diacronema lutheri TaxID=2081491 RepID=A0A8J6C9J0_DIALT|nr:hypothetical protein KFE25_007946 [Diacronema lutheri]
MVSARRSFGRDPNCTRGRISFAHACVIALMCALGTSLHGPTNLSVHAHFAKTCAFGGLAALTGCARLKALLIVFVSMADPCAAEAMRAGAGGQSVGAHGGECASSGGLGSTLLHLRGEAYTLLSERPVVGALIGTSFGWLMTALGAGAVILVKHRAIEAYVQQVLDFMLGVAAGVMIAASYWSLLAPALAYAEEDGYGALACVPVAVGFLSGGALLRLADAALARCGAQLEGLDLYKAAIAAPPAGGPRALAQRTPSPPAALGPAEESGKRRGAGPHVGVRGAARSAAAAPAGSALASAPVQGGAERAQSAQLRVRRMLQLIIAITAHNAPEGLAVGVAFGAIGQRKGEARAAGLGGAISLALGIGIQNFPEGLAVSLPLAREGVPLRTAFAYGQLSGAVEPFFGLLGALFVSSCRPLLPFTMALAAGAMIFVVADSLIPQMHEHGNRALATQGLMLGFATMMVLDVALG